MRADIVKYIDQSVSTTEPGVDGKITLITDPGKIWEYFDTLSQLQEYVARLAVKYKRQGTVIDNGDSVIIELA